MARKKRERGLSVRKVREILRLALNCGMGQREISRSCSVSPTTVGNYLSIACENGLGYAEISCMGDEQLRRVFHGKKVEQKPRPQPDWKEVYRELKKKGVTLQLLWQEYKQVHPDGWQSTQFCEHYRRWRGKLDVSLRQTYKAGELMFVDYAGLTVPVTERSNGMIWEAQVFVAALGASNYTYAEATRDQTLPNWIGSHIRTFEYFQGVARIIVPDNPKVGVSSPCRYEPDLNPTYHDMARHYGCAIIPARARKPKDKAKVETAVQIVERWILAPLRKRIFFSLPEVNRAIWELLDRMNKRPFQKLSGSRLSWFHTIDSPALLPLPQTRYTIAFWKSAKVNIDYHVELFRHYYSVPYQLIHETVEIRSTHTTVEIFHKNKRVASHKRDDAPGVHTTVKEHMPKSHREYLEWTPSRIIKWAATVGEATAQVVETVMNGREHPAQGFRSCMGIMRLGKRYSPQRLEAACRRAIIIRGCCYKSIRSILENELDKQPLPQRNDTCRPPIEHNNIRGSEYYHSPQ
jgi:transposase